MNNYEILLLINQKCKQNIELLNEKGKIEELNECISFSNDLETWLNCYDDFSKMPLTAKSRSECVNSIFMCAQGFYKEAIATLRQCLEHMLFSIYLSSNEYKYRLWKAGRYDMSWTQLMNEQDGVFGKQFIYIYANDIDVDRSTELLTISKNVYRECSEYIHGNFEKLSALSDGVDFNEQAFESYIDYFSSVKYVISMALYIRFRDRLNDAELLSRLEPVIMAYLGTLEEIQLLYGKEGIDEDE